MTKKLGPIAKDKEKDIQLCRQELLDIINNIDTATANATALKVKVEAIKSLGRFHHALQVEKVTAKADAKAAVARISPEREAQLDAQVETFLNGRTTEIIPS